ncbi:hypothetical protein HanXRQr2_Chr17g0784761 [Helianthus annuus]|uniref:Uncharacterized protein n=1 Tax=Helianthus annuus TaxID=4232 RepID=A0A9K3DFU9_HELAN|nr:hypothetical protein HanXRQr2_Chr17g0784761 [Helianthus annuus]KAJ0811629.1 hypothetical protein HanPSC8_Chr17g0752791 [Helianthus annuus]
MDKILYEVIMFSSFCSPVADPGFFSKRFTFLNVRVHMSEHKKIRVGAYV